jgi:two-component system phosphorelay protein LuxU
MNDYVSKPIDRQLLFDKVVHWAGRSTDKIVTVDEGDHEERRASTSADELLDRKALLQLAEDTSAATALRLIDVFIKELRSRAGQIADCHDRSDVDGLASQAHALKSSAATYGAAAIRAQALHLDNACRKSDQTSAMAAAQELLSAVEPTIKALHAYMAEIGKNTGTNDSSG